MKKGLVIVAVLLVAFIAVLLYVERKDVPFLYRESPVYNAIPWNIPVFLEFKSVKSVPLDIPLVRALKKSGEGLLFFDQPGLLDSLLFAKSGKNTPGDHSVIIALKFEGRNDLTPLVIWKTGDNAGKNDISLFIREKFPSTAFRSGQRKYDQFSVTDIYDLKGNPRFSWALEEGLLIGSTKSVLVDQALRQLEAGGLPGDPGFIRVNRTAKTPADISLYIHHRYFPEFLGKWLNQEVKATLDEFGETVTTQYSHDISAIAGFGEWSELDIHLTDDFVKMNGLTIASDSLHPWLQIFKGQQPQAVQAGKILPDNTSFFMSYSISDPEDFFTRLDDYFRAHKMSLKRDSYFSKMEMRSRIDVKKLFREIAEKEITMAITRVPSDVSQKSTFFIFPVKGKSNAREQLMLLLQKYAARTNKTPDDFTVVIDREKKTSAYMFPFPSFPGIWLGRPFHAVKARFFAFRGDYVIMASDEAGLKEFFSKADAGETLSNSITYQRFNQQAEPKTSVNIFLDVAQGFDLGMEYLDQSISGQLPEKREFLEKFRFFNWQITNTEGLYFNNLMISFSEDNVPETGMNKIKTGWQADIGGMPVIPPQFVVNHEYRREREVIVQNSGNILSLISHDGQILWSLDLKEKIMGEIHQVDAMKNGKLQFLFNTGSGIHLVDRNGKRVAPFPIRLDPPATNGMAVFDYDGKREYRIFIATADKRIKVWDISGKIVRGWSFGATESPVSDPVQHFRLGGYDYIVFADNSRIYIRDRKGAERVKIPVVFEKSDNPLLLNTMGTPGIVVTDKTGLVYNFYFSGKFDSLRLGKYSPSHFFTCGNVDNDKVADFIFADQGKVEVWNAAGKKLFAKKFKDQISYRPFIFTWSDNSKKIATGSGEGGKVYLFNSDGSMYKGFPLSGHSGFILGKVDEKTAGYSLVTATRNGTLQSYVLF